MNSDSQFSCIDIIYVIYLDVKYLSVVFLSIYYEKPVAKPTLKMMRHFFAKKLHFCPPDITWDSIALTNTSWRQISSPCLYLGN